MMLKDYKTIFAILTIVIPNMYTNMREYYISFIIFINDEVRLRGEE